MSTTTYDAAKKQLHMTRLLKAPVELVWEVWTNPEHIAKWWGPDGFTNTIHTMDVKPGGEWRLTMHGPDGKNYPNRSEFLEIIPLQKIVYQHFNPDFIATVTFEPQGKQTKLDWVMQFETTDMLETVVKVFKADKGLEQNGEKLEQYLAKMR